MRPSWHQDAKWLFGLICLAGVLVAGGLYSASRLTQHDPSTGIFTGVMATFAKEGAGSEEFAELQALAAASPDEDFTIEGVTLPVKGSDIAGLSYDQAVDLVVGRIAEILYTDGPDSVEQFFTDTAAPDPEEGATGKDEKFGLGPFSLLTQDTHDTASRIFRFSIIAVLVLAAPLIFFSRRFGRLGSPAVVLAAGTAPFAVLWLIVKQATKGTAGEEGIGGALAEALSPTAGDLSSSFLRLLILAVGLALVAVSGHVGFALWHRFRPTPGPPAEPEEQPDAAGDEFPSIGPGGVPQA